MGRPGTGDSASLSLKSIKRLPTLPGTALSIPVLPAHQNLTSKLRLLGTFNINSGLFLLDIADIAVINSEPVQIQYNLRKRLVAGSIEQDD